MKEYRQPTFDGFGGWPRALWVSEKIASDSRFSSRRGYAISISAIVSIVEPLLEPRGVFPT